MGPLFYLWWKARNIKHRADLLAQTARSIAQRDFSQQPESQSRAEIAELAAAVKQMAEDIQGLFPAWVRRALAYIGNLDMTPEQNSQRVTKFVDMISGVVNAKDPHTLDHLHRVAHYSVILAKGVGLKDHQVEEVRVSALLHDVGKIGIEDSILKKPGVLTPEEFEIMKRHTVKGYEIVRPLKQLAEMLPVIRGHHERYDGKGYPDGLAGDMIPMGARIVAVANALDSMTSDQPYRSALPFSEAREIIGREAGQQFDPEIVRLFLSIPDEAWKNMLGT
jgi:putative nucleotidyltransferase with HDIG domain